MPNIRHILSHYRFKEVVVRLAEEYVWWLIRSLPGFEGVWLRYLFLKLTTKRLVQLFTIDGAKDLGFADRTGSLTPGKRADLILIRTGDINMAPVGDPYDAVVALAQPINIDTVVVDGRILRRGNKFTAMDHAKVVADAMQSVAALQTKAKWPA